MITVIKARCSGCDEVQDLTPEAFTLRVCAHAPLSFFTWDCPNCSYHNHRPADDHIISLLMSGGVQAQVWEVPAEALEPRVGPPISYAFDPEGKLSPGQDTAPHGHIYEVAPAGRLVNDKNAPHGMKGLSYTAREAKVIRKLDPKEWR